jgi:hypothetical protein
MLLPADFTETVAATFYDKTVTLLEKTTTSIDGWVEQTGVASSTFKANVQFNNLGAVQTELGLTEQVDVVVTCASDVAIAVDDLFSYQNVTYKALAVIPYDSHKKIVGSKWQ